MSSAIMSHAASHCATLLIPRKLGEIFHRRVPMTAATTISSTQRKAARCQPARFLAASTNSTGSADTAAQKQQP